MLLLLHGSDGVAIRRRLAEIEREADGGTGMLATNLLTLDGRDLRPVDILGPAMAPPFLAPKRVIVVENLLDRYEQKLAQRQQRQPRSVETLNPLFEALAAGIPETTVLIFTGSGDGKNALADRLAKLPGASVERYAAPTGEGLIRYVREEGAARGIRFRPGPSRRPHFDSTEWTGAKDVKSDPAALVALLTQGDTLAIANELDKLALYTLHGDATVDHVFDICAGERLLRDFALTDAVLDGKLAEALSILPIALRDVDSTQAILGQLFSAYRPLVTAAEMLDEGASPEEIGAAIHRPWRNLRDAAIRRARRLGQSGVRRAFEILIAADRSVKAGEVDQYVALEVAITGLCQLMVPLKPPTAVTTAR